MPRKKELGAVQVLEYFQTAPAEAAKLVLQLAGKAIRDREPKSPVGKKPAGPSPHHPAAGAPAAPSAPKPRRQQQPAAPAAATAQSSTSTTGQAPPVGAPPLHGEPAPV